MYYFLTFWEKHHPFSTSWNVRSFNVWSELDQSLFSLSRSLDGKSNYIKKYFSYQFPSTANDEGTHEQWWMIFKLTEPIKKSWCIILTIPKFVYIKTLSIIHMTFGSTSPFVLNVAISIGTSAVDWWLTSTSVLWSNVGVISSPDSTTVEK